jgi:hypothetical protein
LSFAEPLILLLDTIEQHEVIEAALAIHLDPVSRWLTLACIWVPLHVSFQLAVAGDQVLYVVGEVCDALQMLELKDSNQS